MRLLGAPLAFLLLAVSAEAGLTDGVFTVFRGMRDGDFEIYVATRHGLVRENVTRHPARGLRPTRAPACPLTTSRSWPGDAVTPQEVVIRIVYDDSVRTEGLEAAEGFSCLVEVGDVSILFDAGGSGATLLSNMEELGIDAAGLDYIVLSHLHTDHVCGLPALLGECEDRTLLVPATLPDNLSRRAEGLVTALVTQQGHSAEARSEIGTLMSALAAPCTWAGSSRTKPSKLQQAIPASVACSARVLESYLTRGRIAGFSGLENSMPGTPILKLPAEFGGCQRFLLSP